MNKLLIIALLLALIASGMVYSPAQAQTVSECQALIDQTRADLAGLQSIGGRDPVRTQANLDAKLVAASTPYQQFTKACSMSAGLEWMETLATEEKSCPSLFESSGIELPMPGTHLFGAPDDHPH